MQRRLLACIAIVALVGGCQNKGTGGAAGVTTTAAKTTDPSDRLPQTSEVKLSGRTVDRYGAKLLDLTSDISLEAAQNLSAMGPESLRWFHKGLKSDVPHVVEYSVAFFPGETARPYVDIFEPLILPLLESKTYSVRIRSAHALVGMKSDLGIRKVGEKSKDLSVPEDERRSLATALQSGPP